MKSLTHSVLLALTVFLCSCESNKDKPSGNDKAGIPFTLATNYFVRNDYRDSVTHLRKLESREAFEQLFGMAATMGPKGKPTSINFDTHYVLACISNNSDKSIELRAASLAADQSNILLTCIRKEGPVQSFTSRAAVILLVDKHYQGTPQLQLR